MNEDVEDKKMDDDDEDVDTRTALDTFAKKIQALRMNMLCEIDGAELGCMSGEHYLLAMGALDSAQRFATIALYHLCRDD